ncbi:MAG TPA: MaoC/PaaZ C-terminal domain-containing protein [Acidimicrobiales bacterium]|nr:MaoC/PaaZ C-terminal domain-containing protein [Acidimicrobiales bacterium]
MAGAYRRWYGARPVAEGTRYFEDLEVGQELWSPEVVADRDDLIAYGRRYDPWPFHWDEEAAAQTPFGGVIASGGYTISLWYLTGHLLEVAPVAFLGGLDWHVKFAAPLRPGDRLRQRNVVLEKRPSSKPGRGVVRSQIDLLNQDGALVLGIDVVWLIATRP